MGKNSGIEWTDHTWNPWYGCHKVSQGCKNCYMFREQKQYGRDPNVVTRSKTTFHNPLSWKEPALVFTCSWSDFFIEEADPWREEVWDIIRKTPQLTYQILTKRPENIMDRLPKDWGNGWPNVWIGVSAEDQKNANKRIRVLTQIPAKIRFISYEPALSLIDLVRAMPEPEGEDWDVVNEIQDHNDDHEPEEFIEECEEECDWINYGHNLVESSEHKEWVSWRAWRARLARLSRSIDWVIMGCESGPGARSMDIGWTRSMRDQCELAGIPFFLKQMMVDGKLTKMPELDGKVWSEYPEKRTA
jgi:protein gp37